MNRIAILDLGTNTFNLLIAEVDTNNNYTIILSEKRPVKLGEGGINNGEIAKNAFDRGIEAIESYFGKIKQHHVSKIKAFGTSAFRTAKNGADFLETVKKKTNISIEIASGDREAELIYLGVRQTLLLNNTKFLILDIGGGSNELILADMHQIFWKKSYPLGIARLLESFAPSDPLTQQQIDDINNYLTHELADLFELLDKHNIDTLVGASGSFETFAHMISESEVVETEGETQAVSNEIPIESYSLLHEKLLWSTTNEREKMKGLEPMRIEMIVLASIFVTTLFKNHNFKHLYQSNFALKEGAIYELLHNNS